MKYRIKKITTVGGNTQYKVDVKKWYGWVSVGRYGIEWGFSSDLYCTFFVREAALEVIDANYQIYLDRKNGKTLSVEIEYIIK